YRREEVVRVVEEAAVLQPGRERRQAPDQGSGGDDGVMLQGRSPGSQKFSDPDAETEHQKNGQLRPAGEKKAGRQQPRIAGRSGLMPADQGPERQADSE